MPSGLVVRPIQPTDLAGLTRLYGGLKPESRQLRFLGLIEGPTEEQLDAFCRPDHVTREGFVAIARPPSRTRPTLVGHLCLEPGGPATLEGGLAVADGWRGQGIGTTLAVHGLLWARAHDVRFLRMSTYVRNPAAFRLLAQLALRYRQWRIAAGVVELLIDVRPTTRPRGTGSSSDPSPTGGSARQLGVTP